MTERIHQEQPLETAGEPLEDASAAVLLLHGRGATPESVLALASEFDTSGVAYLAPSAANRTWYPNPFTAPLESNQPHLRSALDTIDAALSSIVSSGIDRDAILLLGFSQGACLAAEFAARNPREYGGVAVLSGGLIGPSISSDDYEGSLSDTPVFLGCSDRDPHIARERVEETAAIFDQLGGTVDLQLYPGLGHTINEDEIEAVRSIVSSL